MHDHARIGTPGPAQRPPRRRRMLWCDTLKKWMPESKCRGNCGTDKCPAFSDILERMAKREPSGPSRFRIPAVPQPLAEASRAPDTSMRTRHEDRGSKARFRLDEEK